MESISKRYAAEKTKERDSFDVILRLVYGRGIFGYFLVNLCKWLTPVLYVIFDEGARASLYRRHATIAMSVSPMESPKPISSLNTPTARERFSKT